MEVSGKLENIKQMLKRIRGMKRLAYVKTVQLSQQATNQESVLRLAVLLFGLEESEQEQSDMPAPPGADGAPEPPKAK